MKTWRLVISLCATTFASVAQSRLGKLPHWGYIPCRWPPPVPIVRGWTFDKGGEVDGGEVASDLGRGLRRPRADLRGWRRRGRRILQVTLCILCASVKLITLLSLQQFSNSTCPQFSVGCDVSVWPTACRRAECRSGGCDVSVLATAHALAKRRSGGCGSSVWPTTVGRAKRRTGECDVCVWAATVGRAACRSGGSDVSGKHEHRQTVQ